MREMREMGEMRGMREMGKMREMGRKNFPKLPSTERVGL
jgi:hypothetical protein